MSDVRRLLMAMLALALVTGMAPAAAGSHASDCRTVQPTSIPLVNVPENVGTATVCDEDSDGAFDTVKFDTRGVPVEGVVSLTSEDKRRSDHTDQETEAQAQVSPGVPTGPTVNQEAEIEDEGDDTSIDRIETEGSYESSATSASYILFLFDSDGDGQVDAYGLGVCVPGLNCNAPGPSMLPEVPEKIDLPDVAP